jgi:hypothetical protein
MQALGAYGFLGHVKGKRSFLDFIPAGLIALREILGELDDLAPSSAQRAKCWFPGSLTSLNEILDSLD